jgi:3',5'-cyclic AMP phosphodiesterase CpdA
MTMVKPDNELRVLWLSDIHFANNYTEDDHPDVFEYLRSFFREIKKEHEHVSIDVICISGDIAQFGMPEEYNRFDDCFFKPLIATAGIDLSTTRVIFTPGNHDVNWSNKGFFDEFYKIVEPQVLPKTRVDFFHDNYTKFENLFSSYSEYVVKYLTNAREKNSVLKSLDSKGNIVNRVISDYTKKGLSGFYIDHERKFISIILNTSWFSLGKSFMDFIVTSLMDDLSHVQKNVDEELDKEPEASEIKNFIEEIKKKPLLLEKYGITEKTVFTLEVKKRILVEKRRGEIIKKQLEISANLSEYGSQIVGIEKNYDEFNAVVDFLEQNPNYFAMLVMHHPINWLEWSQYWSYNKEPGSELLNKLINSSHVLMCGHEHVPISSLNQELNDGTIHFRSGCFLFDKQHERVELSSSWFSILNINTDRLTVRQDRYIYETGSQSWRKHDEFSRKHDIKIKHYSLSETKRSGLMNKFTNVDIKFLDTYYSILLENKSSPTFELVGGGPLSNYSLFRLSNNEMCVVVKLLEALKEDKLVDDLDKELLAGQKEERLILRFIILDLAADNNLEYSDASLSGPLMRQRVFHLLTKKSDVTFDLFRAKYFSRKEFRGIDYEGVVFVCDIVPYWRFEELLNSVLVGE